MATYQTYKRQHTKTFKIVDDVLSEYYQLKDQEKILGEDDNLICTHSDLERYDIGDFKFLESQDVNIFKWKKQIEDYKMYIKNLEKEIEKTERFTKHMKETIKNGNGIDRDYCKYLLECEKERGKQ
tara:strand:+ start:643 stop:1020 length:378 start_codon:yes stop_codon:yes gene_type:complete